MNQLWLRGLGYHPASPKFWPTHLVSFTRRRALRGSYAPPVLATFSGCSVGICWQVFHIGTGKPTRKTQNIYPQNSSSQVASNPLGDHFRTQKWVLKWNLQGGLRTQNFWQLFRFWVLKWVLKWYLPPIKKSFKIIQNLIYSMMHSCIMRQTLQHLHFL